MTEKKPLTLLSRQFYWACQLGGWLLYILLNAFQYYLNGSLNGNEAFRLTLIFFFGIIFTEGLRFVIIRRGWLKLPLQQALPRVLAMNVVMAILLTIVHGGLDLLALEKIHMANIRPFYFIAVGYTFIFFFWSLIYFLVHFLENYKKAEIENLRWEASIREIELNKLKSQLNPHFMFNAMNSIRALVGENPQRAKEAVTQLANLLRNTLQMGKHKLIAFGQELDIVRDYLAIESVRLEERLKVEWQVEPGCESVEVPPLMIQTLVENGIKHGIAKLPEGGTLAIKASVESNGLRVVIRNSGQYDSRLKPESGFGLRNTTERLQLLYNGSASFSVQNENANTVITSLFIPKSTVPARAGN